MVVNLDYLIYQLPTSVLQVDVLFSNLDMKWVQTAGQVDLLESWKEARLLHNLCNHKFEWPGLWEASIHRNTTKDLLMESDIRLLSFQMRYFKALS